MARNLKEVKEPEKAKRGTEQRFLEDDLQGVTVFEDTYRDILKRTSTESAKFYLGHGQRTTDDPNAGYMYADVRSTETDADGNAIEIDGRFRFVVYADSEDEVPIVGGTVPSREMRQAANEARRERPVLPLQLPGAGKDKAIAVQFKATPGSDGDTIDPAASEVSIPYTQILD